MVVADSARARSVDTNRRDFAQALLSFWEKVLRWWTTQCQRKPRSETDGGLNAPAGYLRIMFTEQFDPRLSGAARGLGGAGFPAGRKWKIVASEPAPRLMAVNIDEGEPGTFKDRYYLERDPHRFLEGAIIAAWAVGIDDVYIYLRDEYHGCRAILQREARQPLRRSTPAGFHDSIFDVALVPTSAAKSRR